LGKNYIIAVDGPAGSGKSTIARMVAEKLNYLYIDTGAMYRALTLKALKTNTSLDDPLKINQTCTNSRYKNSSHRTIF